MSKKTAHGNKIIIAAVVVIVAGAAWFGYSQQTEHLNNPDLAAAQQAEVAAAEQAPSPRAKVFDAQPGDIVLGKDDAAITIIDYSSLSCPHCAHFHLNVLPNLRKTYIDSGKAKLIYRHFPLNAPALRAAQLVNCAAPAKREKFLQVLFDLQQQWAFNEAYVVQLKEIAKVGGMDSAQFDACIADEDIEAQIITTRKRGAEEAGVNSTPAFFINGVKLAEAPEMDAFDDAIAAQAK